MQDLNKKFMEAAKHENIFLVKKLLQDPRVDPSDNSNFVIRWASENGHLEIVRLLLQDPRVDPSRFNNYAIKWASIEGHLEVVKLLLQDPRVQKKAKELRQTEILELIEKYSEELKCIK